MATAIKIFGWIFVGGLALIILFVLSAIVMGTIDRMIDRRKQRQFSKEMKELTSDFDRDQQED